MKFLQAISTFLLLLVPLLVVESSSSADSASNITRGSSLSSNDTSPNWLSPSGNIAFGFYLLPNDRYVIGIWFVKSPQKSLVWTANRNDLPLHKPSSILFTDQGKLVLRIIPDNKDKLLLPDVPEPASYATMHDDGNFVLYGSDSQVVWESFDYPTDSILGGQKLRPGIDLTSGAFRLLVIQTNGFVGIYQKTDYYFWQYGYIIAESLSTILSHEPDRPLSRPVILSLDTTGKLYLANSDDELVKVVYRDKRKQQVQDDGDYMYRATLSSEGDFILHKERIDGNVGHITTDIITSDDVKVISPTLVMPVVMSGVITILLLGQWW